MTILNQIESYWDKRSSDFNELRKQEMHSPNGQAWTQLILQQLPPHTPLRILDVGTGTGFFSFLLAHQGHQVLGIDMSQQMIDHAKLNGTQFNSNAQFQKMDATKLDFSTSEFDMLISRNVTWTLPDTEAAYAEWLRVLKPGGLLLNFDSDYGQTTFTNTKGHVHENMERDTLDECTNIKNKLPISQEVRPDWDKSILTALGISQLFIEPNIRPLVQVDDNLKYEDVPIFMIKAIK
ncbi:class I SAM-dependent methyltransferase [uncultured Veillonella sp.]|uniref:class I SAM-dependent methyltransferase n=1 Tax=uncultured Veillonella sp. TaxID=159268 RepID=UPI0025F860E2|nr:class I SAM-dependent methyltransferase [uncultured Veillonella sp.]